MSMYLTLFLTYFKIGLFTIGGGYAMIPLMTQEVVVRHGWLTMSELMDFIAVAESTPGPFAVNTATFVGTKMAGLAGAASATLGVVMPSFLIILAIAALFTRFKDNPWVQAALYGMTAVVFGLLSAAVWLLFQSVFIHQAVLDIRGIIICILCAWLYFKKKIKPIPLILIAAVCGIVAYGLI